MDPRRTRTIYIYILHCLYIINLWRLLSYKSTRNVYTWASELSGNSIAWYHRSTSFAVSVAACLLYNCTETTWYQDLAYVLVAWEQTACVVCIFSVCGVYLCMCVCFHFIIFVRCRRLYNLRGGKLMKLRFNVDKNACCIIIIIYFFILFAV